MKWIDLLIRSFNGVKWVIAVAISFNKSILLYFMKSELICFSFGNVVKRNEEGERIAKLITRYRTSNQRKLELN